MCVVNTKLPACCLYVCAGCKLGCILHACIDGVYSIPWLAAFLYMCGLNTYSIAACCLYVR